MTMPLAEELTEFFRKFANVRAVVLAGSRTTTVADDFSDMDLYVYCDGSLPLSDRGNLARSRSDRFEVGNTAFESGDEWLDARSQVWVDIIYRDPNWIEGALSDLFDRFQARIGYSTCLCHNVLTSRPYYDPTGWFAALQNRARQPYPNELVAAIISTNLPLLTERIGSFGNQICRAARRDDRVAVNHRIAAFVASYFDILFAINRVPHPGEKRMREHAARLSLVPRTWEADIDHLFEQSFRGNETDLENAIVTLEARLRELVYLAN